MAPSHHCPAFVLTCMDWRLHPALDTWLRERAGGPVDTVAVAGGPRALSSGGSDAVRDYLLNHIDISVRLHAVKAVILASHDDCGAYGGAAAFADCEAERAKLVGDMKEAAAAVSARFPDLAVTAVLAHLIADGDGWRVEPEVIG